jgi:hypothetical protein
MITLTIHDTFVIQSTHSAKSVWVDYLPLLIAIFTAIFALIQIKSNHITQSRIKWIDELRKNVSEFLVVIRSMNTKISNLISLLADLRVSGKEYEPGKKKLFDEHYPPLAEDIQKASLLINLIVLSLNDNEEKHKKLMDRLQDFVEKAKTSYDKKEMKEFYDVESDCVALSKSILKEEWDRTKRFFPVSTYYKIRKYFHNKKQQNKS